MDNHSNRHKLWLVGWNYYNDQRFKIKIEVPNGIEKLDLKLGAELYGSRDESWGIDNFT